MKWPLSCTLPLLKLATCMYVPSSIVSNPDIIYSIVIHNAHQATRKTRLVHRFMPPQYGQGSMLTRKLRSEVVAHCISQRRLFTETSDKNRPKKIEQETDAELKNCL